MKKLPNNRLGWFRFYANRFNQTGSKRTEHLAYWYLLLNLGLDT